MAVKHHDDNWGWMLAADFFFAGMGAAAVAAAGVLTFAAPGLSSPLVGAVGAVGVGIGALLLILELGKPLRAWRVFTNPKAILTFGAWNMTLTAGLGFVLASFAFPIFPWAGVAILEKLVAGLCVLCGLIVAAYPGVLLARHKARPFWHGPGLIPLFLLSSLATGLALHLLCNAALPAPNQALVQPLAVGTALLLLLQAVLWVAYVYVKRSTGTEHEVAAAERWAKGDLAPGFGLFLAGGMVLPGLLVGLSAPALQVGGALLALGGGALMRLWVIKGGENRTFLPGEQLFRSRLPIGDEAFIRAGK
ncbi:MAG: polysulfide reductase NrfD [Gracilibacteraceae bacterium]|nr:polysulfide reductase NrfD [Gracilibacteraceae bacterium]